MADEQLQEPPRRPVIQYHISLGATLVFTATMLVIYFLGRGAVVYDPAIQAGEELREALTVQTPPMGVQR